MNKKITFKYLIIYFGLYNTPNIFQRYINQILRDFLDDFYLIYLDNILVYSENKEEYTSYYLKVYKRLLKAELHLDINKYKFLVKRVSYLSIILSIDRLEMDPAKIKVVLSWALLQLVKDIQAFIGFMNFY